MDLHAVSTVEGMKVELNRSTLDSVAAPQATPAEISGDNALAASEDTATLSTDKASIEALTAQALNSPEIRQDKVAALRQMIANGEYSLQPEGIAEAMIREG